MIKTKKGSLQGCKQVLMLALAEIANHKKLHGVLERYSDIYVSILQVVFEHVRY